jgi:hypothetical protein
MWSSFERHSTSHCWAAALAFTAAAVAAAAASLFTAAAVADVAVAVIAVTLHLQDVL